MPLKKTEIPAEKLYPDEVLYISKSANFDFAGIEIGLLKEPKNANDFDRTIALWTKYWNDVLRPQDHLSPNVVKALFYSESTFDLKVKDQKVGRGNFARGPLQITEETRKVLSDEKGELSNHFMTLTAEDVRTPELALAASIRWLFHRRQLASRLLQREATWNEAVAHYKGYLKKKNALQSQKGMKNFLNALAMLQNKEKK